MDCLDRLDSKTSIKLQDTTDQGCTRLNIQILLETGGCWPIAPLPGIINIPSPVTVTTASTSDEDRQLGQNVSRYWPGIDCSL